MERQYTAYTHNGRDFISFEFYSEHRSNSKANYEDAKAYYRRKHGTDCGKVINTLYNKQPIL